MNLKNAYLKIFSVVLLVMMMVNVFTGCFDEKDKSALLPESDELTGSVSSVLSESKKESGDKASSKDNALTPDVDKIKLEPESKKSVDCITEEECVEMICKFANPEGNKYDALSILGDFRYPGLSEKEMMQKYETASDLWHKEIVDKVGEKCIVSISLIEKTPVDLSDEAVSEWNTVNEKTAEEYSNVKCSVSTNYSDENVKITFDLVKVDGNWYVAKLSTLNLIRDTITISLFR